MKTRNPALKVRLKRNKNPRKVKINGDKFEGRPIFFGRPFCALYNEKFPRSQVALGNALVSGSCASVSFASFFPTAAKPSFARKPVPKCNLGTRRIDGGGTSAFIKRQKIRGGTFRLRETEPRSTPKKFRDCNAAGFFTYLSPQHENPPDRFPFCRARAESD